MPMNLRKSQAGELRKLVLLCVVSLMPPARSCTTVRGQSAQPSETNREAMYTDQDSYQIYAGLLESEQRSVYVIQGEIHGHPNATRKHLGIEGDREFMREWGALQLCQAKPDRETVAKKFSSPHPLRVDS